MTLAGYFAERGIATMELGPGIATPRVFSEPSAEHLSTRRGAGLFDFSFMACFALDGPGCLAYLDRLQVRDLGRLRPGRIAYTLICREDGSVFNDATVWCHRRDRFSIFTGRRSDLAHLERLAADHDITLTDCSPRLAVCAVQGPRSLEVLSRCFPDYPWATLPYYGFVSWGFSGVPVWVARIGYAGELGYEIVTAEMPALWRRLVAVGAAAGLSECGFESADSLRIEAGHILFSRELAVPATPGELGLGRLLRVDGAPFLGAEALRVRRWNPPARKLVGLLPRDRGAAGFRRLAESAGAGVAPGAGPAANHLTSQCLSPILGRVLGLGFVGYDERHPGTLVELADGRRAQVARLPFYDPAKRLPRQPVS